MARHKTKEEWISWFKKYESSNFNWSDYCNSYGSSVSKESKRWFKSKYKWYINHGESIIVSMTGKKSTGRPKKEKDISWDDFSREELIEIAKRYKEITKDKKKSDKDKEASSLLIAKGKIAWLLDISRTGLYYKKKNLSKRDKEVETLIINIFYKYKCIFGRDRIAAITGINYKRVGRYMKALKLQCITRKAKRNREQKNTSAKYKDLVKRNYNAKNVIATDVSYIKTTNGYNYLSIAIDHYSKKILSWNFSKWNDNSLVLEHFQGMNLKNKIVHSDHGNQYSSNDFKSLSKKKKFKISMSRVGDSLDNREAEYFFSNIKSEWVIHKKITNHNETRKYIFEYINWYNKERPQSVLNWKTPEQAQMSI